VIAEVRCTPDEKIGADAQRGWIDCSGTAEGAPGTERGQPDDARPHRSSDHKARRGVRGDGHQLARGLVRHPGDRPAGRLGVGSADLSQLVGDLPESNDIAGLKDVSNHVIRAVLVLRPQPQRGEQLRGFVDEVATRPGVAQLVDVGLDLPLRPGKQLVQAVHRRSVSSLAACVTRSTAPGHR